MQPQSTLPLPPLLPQPPLLLHYASKGGDEMTRGRHNMRGRQDGVVVIVIVV
jgi:hypothetical protein